MLAIGPIAPLSAMLSAKWDSGTESHEALDAVKDLIVLGV
jgi:hypothetical protein